MKNVIMQVTYFLNGPMLNLLFYFHIIEKVTMRNLARSSTCLENISVSINTIDGSIEMLKNS